MIQKLASVNDARASDILIKIGMYTALENMPLHERHCSAYAG